MLMGKIPFFKPTMAHNKILFLPSSSYSSSPIYPVSSLYGSVGMLHSSITVRMKDCSICHRKLHSSMSKPSLFQLSDSIEYT